MLDNNACNAKLYLVHSEVIRYNQISLESLKARLAAIEKERDAILAVIAVYAEQPLEDSNAYTPVTVRLQPISFSVRGRVVDGIIELIHRVGRQVTNKEILDHLEEKGISLGDTKNKQAMLAAMLSQEVIKKSARLKKVARGVFDIK